MDINKLIRTAYRKDTSVKSIEYTPSQMQAISRGLTQSTPVSKTRIVLSQSGQTPYRGSSILSMVKSPSVQPTAPRTWTTPITTRAISAPVAPTALGRTSSIISAAPLGGGAIPTPSPGVGGGLSGSISNLGSSISDTIQKYMPIAIKVVLAIIAIKVLWWLLRGRR